MDLGFKDKIVARFRIQEDGANASEISDKLEEMGFVILKENESGVSFTGNYSLFKKFIGSLKFNNKRIEFKEKKGLNELFGSVQVYFPIKPSLLI